jgi:hypothetical protein
VGELDTVTGGLDFVARAEKVFGPLPPATAPWRVKRAALAAPRASLGVAYDSRRDAVTARAAVAAAADLGGEAWLEARAAVELDPRPGGVAAPAARVTLAKNVFDFAPAQQVRLAVGVDAASDGKGGVALRPFAAARENCWGVFVDDRGRVSVRYDL